MVLISSFCQCNKCSTEHYFNKSLCCEAPFLDVYGSMTDIPHFQSCKKTSRAVFTLANFITKTHALVTVELLSVLSLDTLTDATGRVAPP
jgi:hypothetical protein